MPTPTYDSADALPTPTFSEIEDGLDPIALPDIVFYEGKLYFFWGPNEDNKVYDPATRTLKTVSGVAPALPTVTAQAPVGVGETGQFWYTYTLYDPDADVETGPGTDLDAVAGQIFAGVVLAGEDATFDIPNPAAGSRFTRARIYRSIKYTVDLRQLTGVDGSDADVTLTPGGGGSVTYVDSFTVSDTVLRTRPVRVPLNKRLLNDGLPPRSATGMLYDGRLYIAEGNVVYWSELAPDLEDFLPENHVTLVGAPGDQSPTVRALRVANGERCVITDDSIYTIFGKSPPFGIRVAYSAGGVQGAWGAKILEELGVIFADSAQPLLYLGSSTVQPVGVMKEFPGQNPVQDLYQEADQGRLKDAVVDVDMDNMRSKVSLAENGAPVNDLHFIHEYGVPGGGAWSLDTRRPLTMRGEWADLTGRRRKVFGNELGQVWQEDLGNSEGAFGPLVSDIVVSATRNTVVGTTGFTVVAAKAGVPVTLRNPTTGEILYRNRLLSYDSGTKTSTMLYPWTVTNLATLATLTVEIGSIEGAWESGWWTAFAERVLGSLRTVWIYFEKMTAGTLRVLFNTNQNETLQVITPDMPLSTDVQQELPLAGDTGAKVKVRVEECAPGNDFAIEGYDVDIVKRQFKR